MAIRQPTHYHIRLACMRPRVLSCCGQQGIYPGIAFFLTKWYKPAERGQRFGYLLAMSPTSAVLGGLFAYGVVPLKKHGKCVRMSLCLCVCASVRAGAFACACVYLLTYLTFNELLWTILTVAVVAAIRVFLLLLLFDLMLVAVCRTPLCRRCQGGKCC